MVPSILRQCPKPAYDANSPAKWVTVDQNSEPLVWMMCSEKDNVYDSQWGYCDSNHWSSCPMIHGQSKTPIIMSDDPRPEQHTDHHVRWSTARATYWSSCPMILSRATYWSSCPMILSRATYWSSCPMIYYQGNLPDRHDRLSAESQGNLQDRYDRLPARSQGNDLIYPTYQMWWCAGIRWCYIPNWVIAPLLWPSHPYHY